MKRMNFSQKLVFVYTCTVVIPLFIIVITAMGFIRNSRIEELEANSEGLVLENYDTVTKNIESFNLFEKLINSNGELTLFFTMPERCSEDEIIETMISETTMLERTLETVPIYTGFVYSATTPLYQNGGRYF